MRSVPAECDALLTCCREEGGVALLRCETSAPQLLLPDELDGLPIIRLGDYVFSAREPKQLPEGAFRLRLTSGGEELPAHDASALRMVRLPQKALSLGNYAFYGCTGLEALEIGGHLQTVGTDAFMNCFSLRRMTLTAPAEECRCLRGLLQEYSGELELCFAPAAGPECRLFFPAYDEDYEEMAAPHIFHYNIRGVGYLCRQSFDGHCFHYDQYDASLDLLLRTHEFSLAVRMAAALSGAAERNCPRGLSFLFGTAHRTGAGAGADRGGHRPPLLFAESGSAGPAGAGRGLRDGPHRPPHRGSGPSAGIPEPAVRRAPCPIL